MTTKRKVGAHRLLRKQVAWNNALLGTKAFIRKETLRLRKLLRKNK